jgi:hypothetical protein
MKREGGATSFLEVLDSGTLLFSDLGSRARI